MKKELEAGSDERFVIINADDFGISHATNQAIMKLFQSGSITSTSMMMPCYAANEASFFSSQNEFVHVGIHLTLTSSENYSYKPVFQEGTLNTLVDKDGFFPLDTSCIEQKADSEEVRIELEAQIKKAIALGINPTHLDSHAGSIMGLFTGRDFLEIVFDLCEKYRLPFNLPRRILEQPFFSKEQKDLFSKRIISAENRGIKLIDDLKGLSYHLNDGEKYEDMKAELMAQISKLKSGITQFVTHPAIVTEELQALTPHYKKRELEFQLYNDPEIKELFEKENVKLVSWKVIRDLQRSKK